MTGLHLTAGLRVAGASIAAFVLGVTLAAAPPAEAFSTLQQEWDGYGSTLCGNASAKLGSWHPCYIGFSYDTSITSRGWQSVVRAGALDWCYHDDPTLLRLAEVPQSC